MLQVAQSPISGHQLLQRPRKPLQPKNSSSSSSPYDAKLKPNVKPIFSSEVDENNKENVNPILFFSTPAKAKAEAEAEAKKDYCFQIESLDASLAEELSAIRQKLDRLRIDKDKTDKMLRERALMLDSQMKEIIDRGVFQKQLEIEVDRLFRLKEIKLLSCTSVSPLRSLRDKEQEKKTQNQHQHHQLKAKSYSENRDEQKVETPLQALNSQAKTKN